MIGAFIDYLTFEKHYSFNTVRAYEKDLKDFEVFCCENYQISLLEVEYVVVRAWIVFLNKQQVSNRSINRKTTALKSFYKYKSKLGEVVLNPMLMHKSLKTVKDVLVPFSIQEIDQVLIGKEERVTFEVCRDLLIIHLIYATGIRRAELIGLKVVDVDLENQHLKVLGKRNKERIVPFYDALKIEIKTYLVFRKLIECQVDNLFVTKTGNKLYPAIVYRIVNLYFSNISTKTKKSPHVLRHSFATDLLNNGADLNSVKELLGHVSLAATQVYTHNSLDKIKQMYNQAHPRGSAIKNKKL